MDPSPAPAESQLPASRVRLSLRGLLLLVGGCGGLLAGVRGESLETAAAALFVVLLCGLLAWTGASLAVRLLEIGGRFRETGRWSVLTAGYRQVHLVGLTGLLGIVAVVISNHVRLHSTGQATWTIAVAWILMPGFLLWLAMRAQRRQTKIPS